MKRKILSILVSFCILLGAVNPALGLIASAATWNGGTSVPTLSGGYYQISTSEELAWFAQQVNSGSVEIKGKLTADITLNDQYSTANNWTPIGNEQYPFNGEFDGNGFAISGLYINTTADNVGLFGYVKGTKPNIDDSDDSSEELFQPNPPIKIQNVTLTNAEIHGNQNVGGICGYLNYAIIKNCKYNGSIDAAANNMGGICGYLSDFARVQRSYTSGTLKGYIRSAGIAGYISGSSIVEDCYSVASVESRANLNGNAGGIVGTASTSKIEGCYFLGNVMGPKKVGGIVGTNSYSTVLGCYTLGQVYTSIVGNTEYIAAFAGYSLGGEYYNCYYNENECLWTDSNAVARTLYQMKKFSFSRELNENGNSFTYDYMVLNNGFPVLAWTLENAVWAGGIEEPSKDSAGYYLIKTADELAWFARLVNGTIAGVDANPRANAKVVDNILLNIFITVGSQDTNVWTPIGTAESPFNGIFMGGGYNIAGLHTRGEKYQGLFGYIGESGTVSEVIVLDGLIMGTENIGGIAGYNTGTISDSCNDSTVSALKSVGGVCGFNLGTIKTSYNAGTVECTGGTGANIGGIAGYNSRGTIRECFNKGEIIGTAGSYFGGVCGNNSGTVTDSYNSGKIKGGYYIGGLIGYNSYGTVTNCYNRGNVNSYNTVNAYANNFIGQNAGSCSISNCYYDTSIEHSVMGYANGAIGKPTSELTGALISTLLGLQAGVWTSKGSETYFDYYPQIMSIATSNFSKMKADSLDSAKVVNSKYILQVKIDGQEDSYYVNFDEALRAISTKKGTIIPVKDITMSQTVNIDGNIIIYGLDYNRKLLRDTSFTGSFFNVTGTLTLGDIKNGTDENILLTIDGNGSDVTAANSIINLEENASLITYPGFEIINSKTSTQGSVALINSGATATFNGGIVKNNSTTSNGGAFYVDMGTLNIAAGDFSLNQATGNTSKGGLIYNNYGTVDVSGGTFDSNLVKTYGGVIYSIGADANILISETASFTNSIANAGGVAYINSGSMTMTGGNMSNNFVYNKRGTIPTNGGGGAITVGASATVSLLGGTISSNYVYNNIGDGFAVADFGTLKLGGSVVITDNDIYLHKSKTIEITEVLTGEGTVVTITPNTYSTSTYVLSGAAMGSSCTKISITPQDGMNWYVNSSGYLMNTEIVNVASLSKFGAYSVEYISLAEAIENVDAGEVGIITIIGNNTISETITIKGDVTILSETDQDFTSMRSGSFRGTLFEVVNGGKLRLGYSETEVEDSGDISPDDEETDNSLVTDSTGGQYHLDGGNNYYGATGTTMISVANGGTLYTYDDFILENSYSTSGTISVSGSMYMYGGTITHNFAGNGGAINISSTGKVYLYGGTITENYLTTGSGLGKAIYCAGTLTRATHSFVYYRNDVPIATQKSYTTITADNDVYFTSGKAMNLANVESRILLSDTSDDIPETTEVIPTPITMTFSDYSVGKVVLKGTDIGLHYTYFNISDDGYYILPNGTLNVDLLVPVSSSTYTISRENGTNYLTGIDLDLSQASAVKRKFVNTDKIEIVDSNGSVLSNAKKVKTGDIVRLYNSEGTEIVDTVYIVILGDVDCDGKIDGRDSILISCYVQGSLDSSNISAPQIKAADIDKSSSINNADVQYIQQVGLLTQSVQQY